MADLPVMLNVRGRRCVVVGGGSVARRRIAALLEAGGQVTVIAPQVDLDEPMRAQVNVVGRRYQRGDLAGAFLVVIATDQPQVNEAAASEARQLGALVNRADDPASGDVTIPAHAHHGPITLAVHTQSISPAAAAAVRRELSAALDPDWISLLQTIAPYRARIQAQCADPQQRQQKLAALGSAHAMECLKKGGLAALQTHCEELCGDGPNHK